MSDVVKRVAVLSMHSSPLVEPGAGDSGGMTIYVRELTAALATRGLSTDIYTRATAGSPRLTSLSENVRVVSIDAGPPAAAKEDLSAFTDEFAEGINAFAAGQRIRYDLVHSHYWHSGVAGAALSETWGVPLVHSHHTLGRVKNRYLAEGDSPEPESRLAGEAEVISRADVLVASTDDEWSQLSCLYSAPHDRLKTVHPGVDHEMFSPGDSAKARRLLGIDDDELVMLYAGRIQPLKGLSLAIDAADQLVGALDRSLVFLVVGGASGRGGDRELARLRSRVHELGLDQTVRFVGPQPHVRLPQFYRASDVVVVSSHTESFGLAALEAQACGRPVVATAVGGLGHIVQDHKTGYLVDERDPAVFAARLKTVLSDDVLRRQLGADAHARAQHFSWNATADEMLELYECLVLEQVPEACTC